MSSDVKLKIGEIAWDQSHVHGELENEKVYLKAIEILAGRLSVYRLDRSIKDLEEEAITDARAAIQHQEQATQEKANAWAAEEIAEGKIHEQH